MKNKYIIISTLIIWMLTNNITTIFAADNYLLKPLSKKFSTQEFLKDEVLFMKKSLDNLNKNNPWIFLPNKTWITYNSLIETDLISLAKAYLKDNKSKIKITSIYRSFTDQKTLRKYYIKTGQAAFSTMPGTSEHHLWTTVDFWLGWNQVKYTWLENNAWKYWFLRSYWSECSDLTWIHPEEWHYRWIWKDNAAEYMKIKKEQNDLWHLYCPISYFRLKTNTWPK